MNTPLDPGLSDFLLVTRFAEKGQGCPLEAQPEWRSAGAASQGNDVGERTLQILSWWILFGMAKERGWLDAENILVFA
jgi:hypothetical protein